MMNSLLGQRYEVRQEIGSGGFGRVCTGYDHKREKEVAIKLEEVDELEGEVSSLKKEQEVYSHLKGEVSIGIADIHLFGADLMDDYGCVLHYMVMDLLGPDLEQLFTDCSEKFSLKTVLLLADQMIRIIQYVHSKDYIHGDIKPGNFVLGRGKTPNMIYMVDFGLAQRYRDSQTKEHIPYSDTASYGGTTRFTSLNCHQRIQQSRRDDLESVGYVLLYLLRGSLPWQGIKHLTDKSEKRRLVYEKKSSIPIEELCTGIPSEFVSYMEYCRSLQFDEEPDYDYLRKQFQDLYDRSDFTDVLEYDWTEKRSETKKFLQDSTIFASSIEPWEAKVFLQVSYNTLPAISNVQEATVEQHVEEAFRFIFPDGPTNCFIKYPSVTKWNTLVPQLCLDFFTNKGDWLKENFQLDYSVASDSERNDQEDIIVQGVNDCTYDNIRYSADLALHIHRVIELLRSQPIGDKHGAPSKDHTEKTNCYKHDKVQLMIHHMLSYTGVSFLYNGACQYDFQQRNIPLRDKKNNGVTIITRPDITLCINRRTFSLGDYPYCIVERNNKQQGDKFMVDDTVTASDVQAWELNYFMKIQHHLHHPKYVIQDASVEEIIEETFRFLYPGEIPEFFSNKIPSEDNIDVCWREIVHKLYNDLLNCETSGIGWLQDQYSLDYTKEDWYKYKDPQRTLLGIGQQSDNLNILKAANFALDMDRILVELIKNKSSMEPVQLDKPSMGPANKRNKLKGMVYQILEFLQIPVMLSGACRPECQYVVKLLEGKRHALKLKAKPDVVLYVNSPDTYLPYCSVKVFCQKCEKQIGERFGHKSSSKSSKGTNITGSATTGIDTDQNLKKSFVTISATDEKSKTDEQSTDIEFTAKGKPHISSRFLSELTNEIKLNMPIMCRSDKACDKLGGQLALEMFILSTLAEKCKPHGSGLKDGNDISIGLFLINEYIHVVKFMYKRSELYPVGKMITAENNGDIMLTEWCFDLKKPNHRTALFVFLHYYHQFIGNKLRNS